MHIVNTQGEKLSNWVVGVDLGATKIEVGLVSPQNQIVGRKRMPTNAIAGPQSVVERIAQSVADLSVLLPENQKIAGLGIAHAAWCDRWVAKSLKKSNITRAKYTKTLASEND